MNETPRATLWRLMPTILTVAALAGGAVLVWRLSDMLLLLLAAVLVALLLRGGADLVSSWTPLGRRAATTVTLLAAGAFLLGFLGLLGRRIYAEVSELVTRVPELANAAEERLGASGINDWLTERAASAVQGSSIAGDVANYATLVLGGLANLFLVLVAGAFMAYAPGLYRDGLVSLFPPRRHAEVRETLDAAGDGLRLWLLGQLIAMALVGVLSTAGLMALGVPWALGLGFIAALTNFVPFIGPFVGALPAVGVALGEQPLLAVWVALLYLAIQQVEGMLITPLIQQRTVELPPALLIFAIVGFGMLFGFLGVVLGAPLTALAFVLVKKLWVRDTLHEETSLPGENA